MIGEIVAPVLFSFIRWTLDKAREIGLKRLYFLARDGHIMFKIAELICLKESIPIECRYLEGSRMAWRKGLMGNLSERVLLQNFQGCSHLSAKTLLMRVEADQTERHEIYAEVGMEKNFDENRVLTKLERHSLCQLLKNSKKYIQKLKEISSDSYQNIMGYFEQEGLFNSKHVGVVDSGWSGSIQETLADLLHSKSPEIEITGLYFGLFNHPTDPRCGTYWPWCIKPSTPPWALAKFNNNVFECLCSSPFPMTLGYCTDENGHFLPIYSTANEESQNIKMAKKLESDILAFVTENYSSEKLRVSSQEALVRLSRLTFSPTYDESVCLSQFYFCDDMSNAYFLPLAQPIDSDRWKDYNFSRRLLNKLFNKSSNFKCMTEIFWSYGSLELSDVRHKRFIKAQLFIWELIRHVIK